jgi:hypothetical protein
VYNLGDVMFVDVMVVDALTKIPYNITTMSSPHINDVKLIVDVYGLDGTFVAEESGYALNTAGGFIFRIPVSNIPTGSYIVRAYGDSVVPSTRQIKIIGDSQILYNFINVTSKFDKKAYYVGDTITLKLRANINQAS